MSRIADTVMDILNQVLDDRDAKTSPLPDGEVSDDLSRFAIEASALFPEDDMAWARSIAEKVYARPWYNNATVKMWLHRSSEFEPSSMPMCILFMQAHPAGYWRKCVGRDGKDV